MVDGNVTYDGHFKGAQVQNPIDIVMLKSSAVTCDLQYDATYIWILCKKCSISPIATYILMWLVLRKLW